MPSNTGVRWVDAIVDEADLPEVVDRESAALVMSRLLRRPVATETLRRWSIRYKLIAGKAFYEPEVLIAFARKAHDEALPRRSVRRSERLRSADEWKGEATPK
jgi:hypothetical protein